MEIITGVERRRRWRLEDKLRIVAEAERPGAILSMVARRHEVSRGLLCQWRDQVRRGALIPRPPVFLPVHVAAEPPVSGVALRPGEAMPSPSVRRHADATLTSGRIEIALADGTLVRVEGEVSPAALRRVLAALRRA
jgi:transposase